MTFSDEFGTKLNYNVSDVSWSDYMDKDGYSVTQVLDQFEEFQWYLCNELSWIGNSMAGQSNVSRGTYLAENNIIHLYLTDY